MRRRERARFFAVDSAEIEHRKDEASVETLNAIFPTFRFG